MIFAHDTEEALQSAAALVNTLADPHRDDELTTVEQLDAFVAHWGWTGSRTHDAAELEAVRTLRPRLKQLWTTPDEVQLVDGINQLLLEGDALPQLVRHDHWSWHLHATTSEQPLATRMAVEAAMALVDVVRSEEMSRLRTCEADDCDDLVIDLSKNRSRRYCEGSCGNKANVAAYRARKAREAAEE